MDIESSEKYQSVHPKQLYISVDVNDINIMNQHGYQ